METVIFYYSLCQTMPGLLQAFLLLIPLFSIQLTGPDLLQQDSTFSTDREPLKIGIEHMPPLAIKEQYGNWSGISVELWRQIADDLNLTYEFQETPQDSLDIQIANGSLDLALCAQANSQDEKLIDFSHIYHATTIGYGDKVPVTFIGRVLALIWMLIAMAITASLTAAIVSVAGMGENGTITIPEDLRDIKVGSIDNTNSAEFLQQENINFLPFESAQEGLNALQSNEIDAFVHSTTVLRYTANQNKNITAPVEATESIPQHFAMALPEGSPMAEPLNRLILENIKSPGWRDLLNRYIPKK